MKRFITFALLIAIALTGAGCNHVEEEDMKNVENAENVSEIAFREIDLSEHRWDGETWKEMGGDARGDVDLSQFAGQAIESREMAERIANVILTQQRRNGFFDGFVLWSLRHDPVQNIWIFLYEHESPDPGMLFYAAVDGNTSELLRMWVY